MWNVLMQWASGDAEWPFPTGETVGALLEPQDPGNPPAIINSTPAERLARLVRHEPGPSRSGPLVTSTDQGYAKKPKGTRRQR